MNKFQKLYLIVFVIVVDSLLYMSPFPTKHLQKIFITRLFYITISNSGRTNANKLSQFNDFYDPIVSLKSPEIFQYLR